MQAIDSAAASRFLDNVIPMRARMIHDSDGNLDSQPYDRNGQVGIIFPLDSPRAHALVPRLSYPLNFLVLEKCINSIDRALLNQGLLDEALAVKSVHVFFQHKAVSIDFDGRVISLLDASTGKEVERGFDLCIGADGSYSIVRRQLMRVVRWVSLSTSERAALWPKMSPFSVAWIFSKNISPMNILNLEYQLVETIVIIQLFSLIQIICISGQGTLSCS
jgi:2-polyprenyl-6-methoxyphenol hydroxylase-like FAD-dependent oxidoreductase